MTDLKTIADKIDTIMDRQEQIGLNLAIYVERQDTAIKRLDNHIADDKEICRDVSIIKNYISNLNGKIFGLSVSGGALVVVVGAFLKSKGIL